MRIMFICGLLLGFCISAAVARETYILHLDKSRFTQDSNKFSGRISIQGENVDILNSERTALNFFDDDLMFSLDSFMRPTKFYRCYVATDLIFGKCVFDSGVRFSQIVCPSLSCSYTKFYGETSFRFSQFDNYLGFENDTFLQHVSFSDNTFNRNPTSKIWPIGFERDYFSHGVDFERSMFYGSINFASSTFEYLDLGNLNCSRNVDLSSTTIKEYLDLSALPHADSISFNFDYAILPSVINLSYNNFNNVVYLVPSKFSSDNVRMSDDGNWRYVNLYNCDPSKVVFDYLNFRLCFFDNIWLSGINISSNGIFNKQIKYAFNGDTLLIAGKKYLISDTNLCRYLIDDRDFYKYLSFVFPALCYRPSESFCQTLGNVFPMLFNRESYDLPVVKAFINMCVYRRNFPYWLGNERIYGVYEKVLNSFEKQGQKISYRTLDIEYQDFKNGNFILPHIWNCYGYHKEWVFYWIIIFLCLFTVLTACMFPFLNRDVYTIDFFRRETLRNTNSYKVMHSTINNRDAELYRSGALNYAWYSFLYTCMIFFLLSLKFENFHFSSKPKKIFGVVYVMIVFLTGIICLGYVANLIIQK